MPVPPYTQANIWANIKDLFNNSVLKLSGAGTPTDGTSGTGADAAGPGSMYVDRTNKTAYINTNTKASPTWSRLLDAVSQLISGTQLSNVGNANVIGGVPVIHRINIAAGANGDTDVILTHKTRVIDAWVVLTGAGVASAVLTVKNGANAITNGMAASGADTTVSRAGTIDDAQHEIAAAGTLRVTGSGGASMPAAVVYVKGLRVA